MSGLTERITKRSSRMFDKIEPGEGLLPTPKSAQKPLKVFGLFVVAGVATMAAGIAVTYLEIGPLMLPKVHMPSHLNQVRAGSAVAHPNPSGNVSLLPEWIERGITQTTKKLEKLILENRTMSLNLQSVDASNTRLKQEVANFVLETAQLKAQVRVLSQKLQQEQLRAQVRNLRRPMLSHPAGISRAPHRQANSIVALQNLPVSPSRQSAPSNVGKKTTARGWMTIAVHGSQAVLQSPGGQVGVVHVGSVIDGAKVTAIHDSGRSVVLNNHQWVYSPK